MSAPEVKEFGGEIEDLSAWFHWLADGIDENAASIELMLVGCFPLLNSDLTIRECGSIQINQNQ